MEVNRNHCYQSERVLHCWSLSAKGQYNRMNPIGQGRCKFCCCFPGWQFGGLRNLTIATRSWFLYFDWTTLLLPGSVTWERGIPDLILVAGKPEKNNFVQALIVEQDWNFPVLCTLGPVAGGLPDSEPGHLFVLNHSDTLLACYLQDGCTCIFPGWQGWYGWFAA